MKAYSGQGTVGMKYTPHTHTYPQTQGCPCHELMSVTTEKNIYLYHTEHRGKTDHYTGEISPGLVRMEGHPR